MAEAKERENRSNSVDHDRVANDVLYQAKSDFEHNQEEQAKEEDNSYKLYGFGMEEQAPSTIKVGPTGKNRSESLYGLLRTRAAESLQQQQEQQSGFADEAGNEERGFQEGYDSGEEPAAQEDGFTDFDNGEGSLDDSLDGKSQEAKAKAAAKKQQLINRQVDRAEDLKAMNEGITDTAGFGASQAPVQAGGFNTAQSLLSKIQAARQKQASDVKNEVVTESQGTERQEQNEGQFL